MKKIIICFFTFLAVEAALSQASPSYDLLSLYTLDRDHGKYVLCVNFDSPGGGKNSFIVIGDTFSVRPPRETPGGAVCDVIMSNVCILNTKIERSPTNKVSQNNFSAPGNIMDFPAHTKVVFNNSVVELSKFKIQNSK